MSMSASGRINIMKRLFADVSRLIDESKSAIAKSVNATLTLMYWKIGRRIDDDILNNKRAEYGREIVSILSGQLVESYGSSFSEKNIRRMIQFAVIFPDEQIVVSLIRQLTWTHFIALIPLKDPLQREFYLQMCRIEKWSVRTLRERIDSMLYERTAISRKSNKLIKQELKKLKDNDSLTPDLVFRDPYFLDFLGLKDTYSEKDLESAILAELQRFITELGRGFAFIARQKRIIIDNEDFCIDLLFFHRKLKCLIVIELKLGKFKAEYKSKMELYLKWLEKNEMQANEKRPIGLILCTEGNREQIELLELHKSGIRVAEYMTELPDRRLLKKKLHEAVEISKKRLTGIGI